MLFKATVFAAVLMAGPVVAQEHWVAHKPEVAALDAAVRAPLEAYLLGQATGDPVQFRQAFHDEAQLWGLRSGTLIRMTDDDYMARAGAGRPADDEAMRRRWIETVDVTGDVGIAKIVLDYPTAMVVDYLQLMRVDGRWQIVNKTYQVEPKAPS